MSSVTSDPVESSLPRGARVRRAGRGFALRGLRLLLLALGGFVILCAVLTLVARLGLPLVAGYKSDIEAGLGDYLKRPVFIDDIELRWRRTGPELTAMGVELREDDGRSVAIDQALLDVNLFASALQRTLVINELTLVGADLAIERSGDGTIRMLGLPQGERPGRARAESRGLNAASWLFNARRVGMLDTRISIIDHADDGFAEPVMVIGPVDLRAENADGEQRLRLSADLGNSTGGQIDFAVDLGSTAVRAFDGHANGRFSISVQELDMRAALDLLQSTLSADVSASLDAWQSHVDIASGVMSLNLAGVLEDGRATQAEGRVELSDLASTTGVSVADTVLLPVSWGLASADKWQLNADGLDVRGAGESLRAERLRVFRSPEGVTVDASGNEGSLQLAASLVQLLPSVDSAGWIKDAQPVGRIAAWRTLVELGDEQPNIDVVVSVPELSFSSALGAPGLSPLAMSLVVDDNRGYIEARSPTEEPVVLSWPGLYSNTLQLDGLDTVMSVAPGEQGVRIEGPVSLSSGSLEYTGGVAVDIEPSVSPYIELDGSFSLDDVAEVSGFLPNLLLGQATTDWFAEGLLRGSATDGTLKLSGRAADFPYDNGEGVFRASMRARDVDLFWLEDWPTADALNGIVSFEGAGFSADVSSGRVLSMDVNRGVISIPDMRVPTLTVDASGTDVLPPMLEFATTGPLRDILEEALEDVSGSGPAGLDLIVKTPLSDFAEKVGPPFSVDGHIYLRDSPVTFGVAELDLQAVTGAIRFDLDGITISSLKARWLDRPVSFDASMHGTGVDQLLRVRMRGAVEGSDVLAHYGLPLDRFVRGASQWTATLEIPFDGERQRRDGFSLVSTSDLIGSELQLPAPLYKPSRQARPMTVAARIFPDEPITRWTVRQPGHADVVVDVTADEMLSLSMGLGDNLARTEGVPGIRIDGRVDVLDVDGWVEALATLISDLPTDESSAAGSEPITAVSANIVAGRAVLRSMPLGELRLAINSDERYLNAVIRNRFLEGNARYPRWHTPGSTDTPLKVRLTRVEERLVDALLGEAEEEEEEIESADEGLDPRTLPPVEAYVASLKWKQLDVAGLSLKTEPDIAGLNIVALGFSHQDLNLIGEGYWRLSDPQGVSFTRVGQHETRLSLILQSSDFGRGLDGIGLSDLIGGGAGRARAVLDWPGPAWGPEINTIDGNLEVDLERGSIAGVEPGAGRLIGLFALQALPQRLNLDFTDVTHDGLAFSTLTGDATIERGVVDASLVRFEGPIGVIDVTGTTDLDAQLLEQRVTVLPRVGAALPIIGAIAGGASAGIGVLVAGGLLKALGVDLDRIGLREFRLHGSWDDPQFDPWTNKR